MNLMDRIFKYQDPDGVHVVTEDEIRTQYFPYWKELMAKIGKLEEATFEKCIEDFIVVHWAYEVKQ